MPEVNTEVGDGELTPLEGEDVELPMVSVRFGHWLFSTVIPSNCPLDMDQLDSNNTTIIKQ